jgi:hypothetical protein
VAVLTGKVQGGTAVLHRDSSRTAVVQKPFSEAMARVPDLQHAACVKPAAGQAHTQKTWQAYTASARVLQTTQGKPPAQALLHHTPRPPTCTLWHSGPLGMTECVPLK